MTRQAKKKETLSPPFKDSDAMYLMARRLDAIGQKMQRLEYDTELDTMMRELADWFEWFAEQYAERIDGGE